MKTVNAVVKILTALAAVAGAVYIVATYGEQIVAWAKKLLASLPKCPSCEETGPVEDPAEEAPAEVPAEEPAAAEAAEEVSASEEAPAEASAPEAPAVENAPVAEEADFVE